MGKGYGNTRTKRPKTSTKTLEQKIQNFANKAFSAGQSKGKSLNVGTLSNEIISDMKAKGVKIESKSVVLTDDVITKYVNHVKRQKGATIEQKRYKDIERLINNPTHVYEDVKQKYLVYVNTIDYKEGKVLKGIIHPNYKHKGKIYNKLKSLGVVNESDMNDRIQYRRIK